MLNSFNPRPREGSDADVVVDWPTWKGFNPRPREGSDLSGLPSLVGGKGFQSAPPRRERYSLAVAKALAVLVSIRAPAKGAMPKFCVGW